MKRREKGEKYRPIATILKNKGDVPSVLLISGRKYILSNESQRQVGGGHNQKTHKYKNKGLSREEKLEVRGKQD